MAGGKQDRERQRAELEVLQQGVEQFQAQLSVFGELLQNALSDLQAQLNEQHASLEDQLAALRGRVAAVAAPPSVPPVAPVTPVAPAPPPVERRTSRRRGGNLLSVMYHLPNNNEEQFPGWILDRSGGGIALLVDEEVPADAVLVVRPNLDHPDTDWVKVRVTNCRPMRSSFVLGCQFVDPPSWKVLRLFG